MPKNKKQRILITRESLIIIFGILGMIFASVIEARFDEKITEAVDFDATPYLSSLEGNFHHDSQNYLNFGWLKQAMTIVYVDIFAIFFFFPVAIFLFMQKSDVKIARKIFCAYLICGAVFLPFYIFFPVDEVWVSGKAENVIAHQWTFTGINKDVHAINSLNNSFPSMHVALSLASSLIVYSQRKLLGRILLGFAALIAFSTIYLGIHWVTDVIVGAALAFLAVRFSDRIFLYDWLGRIGM